MRADGLAKTDSISGTMRIRVGGVQTLYSMAVRQPCTTLNSSSTITSFSTESNGEITHQWTVSNQKCFVINNDDESENVPNLICMWLRSMCEVSRLKQEERERINQNLTLN